MNTTLSRLVGNSGDMLGVVEVVEVVLEFGGDVHLHEQDVVCHCGSLFVFGVTASAYAARASVNLLVDRAGAIGVVRANL